MQKNEVRFLPYTVYKYSLNMDQRPKLKTKIIKLFEEDRRKAS